MAPGSTKINKLGNQFVCCIVSVEAQTTVFSEVVVTHTCASICTRNDSTTGEKVGKSTDAEAFWRRKGPESPSQEEEEEGKQGWRAEAPYLCRYLRVRSLQLILDFLYALLDRWTDWVSEWVGEWVGSQVMGVLEERRWRRGQGASSKREGGGRGLSGCFGGKSRNREKTIWNKMKLPKSLRWGDTTVFICSSE